MRGLPVSAGLCVAVFIQKSPEMLHASSPVPTRSCGGTHAGSWQQSMMDGDVGSLPHTVGFSHMSRFPFTELT